MSVVHPVFSKTDGAEDAILDSAFPLSNWGGLNVCRCGVSAVAKEGSSFYRGAKRVQISIPKDANITAANIYCYATTIAGAPENWDTWRVTKCLRDWVEGDCDGDCAIGISWENWEGNPGASPPTNSPWTVPGAEGEDTDIDSDVEDLYTGPADIGWHTIDVSNTVADAVANCGGEWNVIFRRPAALAEVAWWEWASREIGGAQRIEWYLRVTYDLGGQEEAWVGVL